MQVRDDSSAGQSPANDKHDDLLYRRMAILGVDQYAIEWGCSEAFDKVRQRCASCRARQACAVDLKRDPDNPVWKSYCPNSEVLNAAFRGLQTDFNRSKDPFSGLAFFNSLSAPW
jgi:hypothetical protein